MEHPYDRLYLQQIAETQGALFESLQDCEPTVDGQVLSGGKSEELRVKSLEELQ